MDKNVLSVVPSVKGNKPALNSNITRLAYASSSGVHSPLLSGGRFFLLELVEVGFTPALLVLLENCGRADVVDDCGHAEVVVDPR